jgi:hypothetical protein
MATTYLDFSALSITDNVIHQDTQLDFFLNAKALSPKTSLHFTVAKNVSLTLIFVDLLSAPLTLSVVVDLAGWQQGRCESRLALPGRRR